jgi:hypothetical protein
MTQQWRLTPEVRVQLRARGGKHRLQRHTDSRKQVTTMQRILLALLSAFAAVTATAAVASDWNLADGARVHPDYRGSVPKKSDVIFSTRFKRGQALAAAKSFGATRVEWVYSTEGPYVQSLRNGIGWFGGALNAIAELPNPDGTVKDFDGNPVTNPRMKSWRVFWDTTTHPDTERVLRGQAKQILDLGADSLQIDDPLLQLYAAQLWGGDFNPSTLAGFSSWLRRYPDRGELARAGLDKLDGDYRDHLKREYHVRDARDYLKRFKTFASTPIWLKYIQSTVAQHFADFRPFLDKTRGARVPLSMNLGLLDRPDERNGHFFLTEYADYAIAETAVKPSDQMQMRAATLRALGIGLVPVTKAKNTADGRAAIATWYALGAQPMVPWDLFLGNDDSGRSTRLFGTADDYGDLYAFVRAHAKLFDGMETAAVVGIVVPVGKFDEKATLPLIARLAQQRIPFAFVLAGGTDRKLVIDAPRVQHFKTLISVNPDTDFSPDDLTALRASKVPRINGADLRDVALQELMPFVAVGEAAALRLYPRARPGSNINQIAVHVVDEARAAAPADSTCRRRIGIHKSFLGAKEVRSVTWNSGTHEQSLDVTNGDRDIFVTVPECTLWGVLLVQMKQ